MTTVLTESNQGKFETRSGDSLWLAQEEVSSLTGWTLKTEGFCRDDVCVPVPVGREPEFVSAGSVNVSAFWELMGKPAVSSADASVWFLGEGALDRNTALQNLEAPNFTLPDLEGNLISLTDFRRKRVLLITWASW